MTRLFVPACLAALLASTVVLRADWKPVEKIETYAVSGTSGIELYRSIGDRGPSVGVGLAIAFTTYELLWSRDYRPEAGGCRLASARPKLTIIHKWPKPSQKLPTATAQAWSRFIAGIEKHERVHGQIILETVRKIEAATVGITVAGDSGCKEIRQEVTRRVAELAEAMRAESRAFDKKEMSEGGNVHQLVLALVNGDR